VVIDRVDSSGTATPSTEETVVGVVSGDNLINCLRGVEGTAQAHSAGAVVEVLMTADNINDMVDGILVEHTQLGKHQDITASTISASTVSASKVTASDIVATSSVSSTTVTASEIVASEISPQTTNASLKIDGGIYTAEQTYTPSASGTATLDLSKGNIHKITMPAGNITIAVSNETVGQCFLVEITQDATGSRTVTWFSTIKWAGGSAPTLTTTGNKRDVYGFRVTGTDTYDGFIVGENI